MVVTGFEFVSCSRFVEGICLQSASASASSYNFCRYFSLLELMKPNLRFNDVDIAVFSYFQFEFRPEFYHIHLGCFACFIVSNSSFECSSSWSKEYCHIVRV